MDKELIQITKIGIVVLATVFVAGLISGLIAGYLITIRLQPSGNHEDLEREFYTCVGDTDQLTTTWSYAVDNDLSTKVEWNTTSLGDFYVHIVENFTIPSLLTGAKWEFKAYHNNTGSLMPTPMEISYWNGSSWKQLYALDDEEHVNEVFVETLDLPKGAFSDNEISIRTTIRYSSHVVGAILPYAPEQLWHYVEYFEGRMIMISE